jgi:hypothetical protein
MGRRIVQDQVAVVDQDEQPCHVLAGGGLLHLLVVEAVDRDGRPLVVVAGEPDAVLRVRPEEAAALKRAGADAQIASNWPMAS